MNPPEHGFDAHDMNHEPAALHEHHEEHIHFEGDGCGEHDHHHVETHIDHAEHVHDASCGHLDHHAAHEHRDTGHVHSEQCGHLHPHDAHEHIDRGHVCSEHCEHAHHDADAYIDKGTRHTHDHDNSHEHAHHPGCGHVDAEQTHEYVDRVPELQVHVQALHEQEPERYVPEEITAIIAPTPDAAVTSEATAHEAERTPPAIVLPEAAAVETLASLKAPALLIEGEEPAYAESHVPVAVEPAAQEEREAHISSAKDIAVEAIALADLPAPEDIAEDPVIPPAVVSEPTILSVSEMSLVLIPEQESMPAISEAAPELIEVETLLKTEVPEVMPDEQMAVLEPVITEIIARLEVALVLSETTPMLPKMVRESTVELANYLPPVEKAGLLEAVQAENMPAVLSMLERLCEQTRAGLFRERGMAYGALSAAAGQNTGTLLGRLVLLLLSPFEVPRMRVYTNA